MNHPFTQGSCAIVPTSPEWMLDALCREIGGDYWYADSGPNSTSDMNIAKRACFRCPVQLKCLQHAIDTNERHGIWGGVTRENRDDLVRREGRRDGVALLAFRHGTQPALDRHLFSGESPCEPCRRGLLKKKWR